MEPTSVTPKVTKKSTRSMLDIAYGGFSTIIAFVLLMDTIEILPMSSDSKEGWLALFGMTGGVLMLGAVPAVIVLSILCWREWPLLLNSLLCIFGIVFFVMQDDRKIVSDNLATAVYVAIGIIVTFFCLRWFAYSRSKYEMPAKVSS